MAEQLPIPLDVMPTFGRHDFVVSTANATAVAMVDGWVAWSAGTLALIGPAGSGKSHLARIWASGLSQSAIVTGASLNTDRVRDLMRLDGIVLEDADQVVDEVNLFHLLNAVRERGGRLLLTARTPPARWPYRVPDLTSRLRALTVAELKAPDDVLLAAVVTKLFSDRQIAVPAGVVSLLVDRMPRSFQAARDIVTRLDHESLARKRAITPALVRAILADSYPSCD